jgi:D-alanyl-D-alanine carboxypeptidase
VLVGAVCTGAYLLTQSSKPPISPARRTSSVVQHSASSPTPSFDKTSYSTTDPASPWVVVNKQHPLQPKTYIPDDLVTPTVPLRVPGNESMQLRSTTAKALESMFAVAKTDNINLMISSGYRSYTYQVSLYGSYVSSMGQARADTQSARPGFSEHQTGQALDIEPTSRKCEVAQCFADTPEGKWLVANAYRYGFILRYTPADVAVTGYESEPWHYRYVGIPLATEMHKTGVATLEQFFGVSGGQNY